jgi:hypothetical protein
VSRYVPRPCFLKTHLATHARHTARHTACSTVSIDFPISRFPHARDSARLPDIPISISRRPNARKTVFRPPEIAPISHRREPRFPPTEGAGKHGQRPTGAWHSTRPSRRSPAFVLHPHPDLTHIPAPYRQVVRHPDALYRPAPPERPIAHNSAKITQPIGTYRPTQTTPG